MAELTPADYKRCQAEVGGAFQLGGVRRRCESKPAWIAMENKPGSDGKKGEMSLCTDCEQAFKRTMPKGFATVIPITEEMMAMRKVNRILKESEDARFIASYFLRRVAKDILDSTGDPFNCREQWETKAADFEERAGQIERGENLRDG